ncbi:MAG: 1,6-anhydro-N-acetylmuramyl-L-alanine amidase AmpD [Gammaproteobacteria bacterium]|nr:1,6-anhydro-N-acetylmuramyl-L-alanine amidase AmpD [Gammaproteobacteria bacterium]
MELDPGRNWIAGARQVPSPHCDDRPPDAEISLIVIHGISLPPRQYGGPYIDQLFTGTLDAAAHPYFAEIAALRVSSHLLVDRCGAVTQYVSLARRAWHAGQSCFRGREECNDFSVGMEFEGCDDEAYSGVQYEMGAALAAAIMSAWPAIGPDSVVRHSDISPGRKTDPGPAFEWEKFLAMIAASRAS